jgi:hypothetical protein
VQLAGQFVHIHGGEWQAVGGDVERRIRPILSSRSRAIWQGLQVL